MVTVELRTTHLVPELRKILVWTPVRIAPLSTIEDAPATLQNGLNKVRFLTDCA